MMIPRLFVHILLLAVLSLSSAHAQSQANVPRIGFLSATTPESPGMSQQIAGFRQGLRDQGYVEGTNIAIEYRFARERFDRLPDLARELIGMGVDVLVTAVTQASLAARDNTKTIPIVMIAIERAFETISKDRPAGLTVLADPTLSAHAPRIAALAEKAGLPSVSGVSHYAEAGGLMAYGPNFYELYRSAAGHVAKILRGAKPAELPIEQPTKFELVINMKTAKQLGLSLPQSLLLRADRVIE